MGNTNIFRHYSQDENRYTNGLISLLKMGSISNYPLLGIFFKDLTGIKLSRNLSFKVLREYNGTADAEISSEDSIILLETKIVSGTLREEQIKRHLKSLAKYKQKTKRLVLLPPDSLGSHYIHQFVKIAPRRIIHLNWGSVISFLQNYRNKDKLFSQLVKEYIEEVKEEIFEQDISSVIVKINFGDKSQVYPEDYLQEFRDGEWEDWHTPKKYHELDGRGKKLILYDKHRGLVLEAEIERVKKIPNRKNYPWSNKFVKKSLKIYRKPIPLQMIKKIPDIDDKFSNFDKCSTSHWNLTREQYGWLMNKNG